jgi:hypothetical protein
MARRRCHGCHDNRAPPGENPLKRENKVAGNSAGGRGHGWVEVTHGGRCTTTPAAAVAAGEELEVGEDLDEGSGCHPSLIYWGERMVWPRAVAPPPSD